MFFIEWIRARLIHLLGVLFAMSYDSIAVRLEASGVGRRRCMLTALIPRGAHVLEVGAGTGSSVAVGAYSGPKGRFGRVVLSEPDAGMRSRLVRKLEQNPRAVATERSEVSDAKMPTVPFADCEFDAVVAFFVLSHVQGRDACMRELFRLLKPRGLLILMDHAASEGEEGHGDGDGDGHGHDHDRGHRHGHRHDGEFSLSWLREWWRFSNLIRRNRHRHGDNGMEGMSFEPLTGAVKSAGFKALLTNTFETENSAMDMMKTLVYSVAMKPADAVERGRRKEA